MTKAKVIRSSPLVKSSVPTKGCEQINSCWKPKNLFNASYPIRREDKCCIPNVTSSFSHQNTLGQSRRSSHIEINLVEWSKKRKYQTTKANRRVPCKFHNSTNCDHNDENGNKNTGDIKKDIKYRNSREKRSLCREPIVRFNPNVLVKKILSHRNYSFIAKSSIWSSTREIRINARRNAIEFNSEGRNWRCVVEENKMWTDMNSGALIHPIHFSSHVSKYYNQV